MADIHHHTGKDFDFPVFFSLNPHIRNSCILDLAGQLSGHIGTLFCEDFTGKRIHNSLCKLMSDNTFVKVKLLIKFITSDLCQIIPSRIEEHGCNQAFRTLYRKRLARSDLLVKLQQTFLIVGRGILSEAGENLRLLTKQLHDLRICAYSQCTNQYGNGNFSGSVHTNIKYIIGICLIFQPCASVWNNGTGK